MSLIIPANSAAAGGGFNVDNSCMFNSADSASMQKTAGTPTDNNKWTFSAWVKRSKLGTLQEILYGEANSTNYCTIRFNDTTDFLTFKNRPGSTTGELVTKRVFRDVASWYHIVVVLDTSNATAANRDIIYINGVRETEFTLENHSGDGDVCYINSNGNPTKIGKGNSASFFDGYMAEVNFIDGQALAPTEFGEFDEDSGIWKPIDASGLTFGNNGFYLDFKDSTNLGNDANGGTDLTETNLAATDQMIDTCTKNFPTLNSLEGASSAVGTNTYSQGNLQVLTPVGGNGNTLSSIGVSSGKWYSEFYIKASSGVQRPLVGVSGDVGATLLVSNNMGSLSGARDVGYMGNDGDKFVSGSESSYGGSAFSNGDVIGVALDLDNNTVNFAQNNSFKGTIAIASTGTWHMGCGDVSGGIAATIVANYGQNSSFAGSITAANETDEHGEGLFKFAPPSGFITLNTTNLAEYG
jgi:hypothetical protein